MIDWGGEPLGDGAAHSWRIVDAATQTVVANVEHLELLVPSRLLNLSFLAPGLKGWMELEGELLINGKTGSIQ